jgi:hypothetical protein
MPQVTLGLREFHHKGEGLKPKKIKFLPKRRLKMNQGDSLVCHRCFNDKSLIDYIREEGVRSWCDWCGARNVYVVPLYMLGDVFRDAVSIYEPGKLDDESISFLFQEDWEVFSDKIEQAPNDLMQEMTLAILKAGLRPKEYLFEYPDYNEGFRREETWLVEHWHEKAEAYFSEGDSLHQPVESESQIREQKYADFPDQLEVAFENLSDTYDPGKIMYRARIHKDRFRAERFTPCELSAPPTNKTPAGRANRKNEPVLYVANDYHTALSEVRAWKGTVVAIADIKIKKRLSVVSLLSYKLPNSPFFDDLLRWKVQLAPLFERLAYELSMPIIAREDEKLYFSTQYLCDWVRKSGYDGIEYPSAMGGGFNIALFNPKDAEVVDIKYVRITGIKHEFNILKNHDHIYGEGPFDYLFR